MKDFLKSPLSNLSGLLIGLLIAVSLLLGGSVTGGSAEPLAALGASNFDVLQAADGTAGAPSFSFTTDTDTGFYLSSANTIGMAGAFATGDITAAEIANPTRNITLPLLSFIECDSAAGVLIGFDATADAFPDYVNSATDGIGFSLSFDDTGGSVDSAEVCTNFQVPQDYASGGSYRFSITKDGETTGTTSERLVVNANIAGGALVTADTDNIVGAAEQEINSTPTVITYAAGDSVGMTFAITSASTMDDVVNILSVSFEYLATQ